MTRPLPLLLLLAACGGKDGGTTTPPLTAAGTTTDSSTPGGTAGGTAGGTVGGSPTGTTTTVPTVDFCPAWPPATGNVLAAGPGDVATLQATLDGMTSGDTLELTAGTYALTAPLVLSVDGVTVRSASGVRSDVVLDGGELTDEIFEVLANDVSLVSMTLTHARSNGVTIVPATANITGTQLYDLEIVDNPQYGVYVAANGALHADEGTIACSRIHLTTAGREDVRNGCLTAGVEASRAAGWTIMDTEVEGFWCDIGSAVGGIRFWQGSRDTAVLRVRAVDNHRGILLGDGDSVIVRTYPDNPCGAGVLTQHYGGTVHNSLVWAADNNLVDSLSGIESGLVLDAACDVEVLHNTVHIGDTAVVGDLVHRYSTTSGVIANNLVHKVIFRLEGSTAVAANNIENVGDYTWVHVPSGDFHIAPGATTPVDAGDPTWLKSVPDDAEGQPRSPTPDCGMDERP